MLVRTAMLAAGSLLVLLGAVGCSSRSYPTAKPDNSYDLSEMRLRDADLPQGFAEAALTQHVFPNAQWAQLFNTPDTTAMAKQLDSEGRVRGYVAVYEPQQLGQVFSINTISTLYKDVNSAKQSEAKHACGTPTADNVEIDPFPAPTIADQSIGFITPPQGSNNGSTPVSATTFCFRTGRIVHAIQLTGLAGTEDVALSVDLAQRMLTRVQQVFDGHPAPTDTPAPSVEPSAAAQDGSATAAGTETPVSGTPTGSTPNTPVGSATPATGSPTATTQP